jgi:hypothetical protein
MVERYKPAGSAPQANTRAAIFSSSVKASSLAVEDSLVSTRLAPAAARMYGNDRMFWQPQGLEA